MAEVVLPRVRIRFPFLWSPQEHRPAPGQTTARPPTYSVNGIFASDSDAFRAANKAFLTAGQEKWKDGAQAMIAEMGTNQKCVRRGDTKRRQADGVVYEGFAGMFYITASRPAKEGPPLVVASMLHNGQPIIIGANGETYVNGVQVQLPFAVKRPYDGAVCDVKVDIYALAGKAGQAPGIFAKLIAVRFVEDAPAFGSGGPATADGFGYDSAPAAAQQPDMGDKIPF